MFSNDDQPRVGLNITLAQFEFGKGVSSVFWYPLNGTAPRQLLSPSLSLRSQGNRPVTAN